MVVVGVQAVTAYPGPNPTKQSTKNFPIRQGAALDRGTSANMLGTRFLCHAILSINQVPWNNLLIALESSGSILPRSMSSGV